MEAVLQDLPFLPMDDPGFSLRAPEVAAARAASWCARTPYGLAVLRHQEMGELLRHTLLRQGSHAWPALNKVTGPFADWWARSMLVGEGNVSEPTEIDRYFIEGWGYHPRPARLPDPCQGGGEGGVLPRRRLRFRQDDRRLRQGQRTGRHPGRPRGPSALVAPAIWGGRNCPIRSG